MVGHLHEQKSTEKKILYGDQTQFGTILSIFFIVAIGVAFFSEFVRLNRICAYPEIPILMRRI